MQKPMPWMNLGGVAKAVDIIHCRSMIVINGVVAKVLVDPGVRHLLWIPEAVPHESPTTFTVEFSRRTMDLHAEIPFSLR